MDSSAEGWLRRRQSHRFRLGVVLTGTHHAGTEDQHREPTHLDAEASHRASVAQHRLVRSGRLRLDPELSWVHSAPLGRLHTDLRVQALT